jgi:hypothetical protein
MGKSENYTPSPASNAISFRFALLYMAAPYLIGLLVSRKDDLFASWLHPPLSSERSAKEDSGSLKKYHIELFSHGAIEQCSQALLTRLTRKDGGTEPQSSAFENLSLVVHRNGEHQPCGIVSSDSLLEDLRKTVETLDACPNWESKYEVESFLTRFLHYKVSSSCPSVEKDRSLDVGFYGFCDMGESRTPILLDHKKLVPNISGGEKFLPCHFHTQQGVRVTSLAALEAHASQARVPEGEVASSGATSARRELHLYAVPAGRVFMFAPSHVGQIIDLPQVKGADPTKPVYLEVMSLSPRVFDLVNFFTREESETLIDRAHKEQREDFRIKRSSTGAVGYTVNSRRTSESGFDTTSPTAMALKRYVFSPCSESTVSLALMLTDGVLFDSLFIRPNGSIGDVSKFWAMMST